MRVEKIEDRWSQEQLVTGISTGQWLSMLSDNGWDVSPDYWLRAAWIGLLGLPMSVLRLIEQRRYGEQIANMAIDPVPIFGLGHWRSGTTHLHNLLGRDPQHDYTTVYQVVFPDTFLTSREWGPKLLAKALPAKRSYDNMPHGWFEPAEDEIGLMKLARGRSFYVSVMFPDRAEEYRKYIDFADASDEDRRLFQDALTTMIKKCMIANGGKRMIIKSCMHSARIPLLLDLFPDARFVHVHRHPARVFTSMVHMRTKVDWENFMHRPTKEFIELRREHTAQVGEILFRRLIEDRELIPEGNLVEIAYDDLCGDEFEVVRGIYERFELPGWEEYAPLLRDYLDRIAGYKVNKFEIDDETLDFVYDRWRLVYDTYGYEREFTGR